VIRGELHVNAQLWLLDTRRLSAEATGVYITLAAWAAAEAVDDLRVPKKAMREQFPRRHLARRYRELEDVGLVTVEKNHVRLSEVGRTHRWIFLGTNKDRFFVGKADPLCKMLTRRAATRSDGRRPLPSWVRERVIERDEMVCGLCEEAVESRADIHIDHIVPVVLGGTDELDNLQVAHAHCNLRKGARAEV
jgi:hypothetical protein